MQLPHFPVCIVVVSFSLGTFFVVTSINYTNWPPSQLAAFHNNSQLLWILCVHTKRLFLFIHIYFLHLGFDLRLCVIINITCFRSWNSLWFHKFALSFSLELFFLFIHKFHYKRAYNSTTQTIIIQKFITWYKTEKIIIIIIILSFFYVSCERNKKTQFF